MARKTAEQSPPDQRGRGTWGFSNSGPHLHQKTALCRQEERHPTRSRDPNGRELPRPSSYFADGEATQAPAEFQWRPTTRLRTAAPSSIGVSSSSSSLLLSSWVSWGGVPDPAGLVTQRDQQREAKPTRTQGHGGDFPSFRLCFSFKCHRHKSRRAKEHNKTRTPTTTHRATYTAGDFPFFLRLRLLSLSTWKTEDRTATREVTRSKSPHGHGGDFPSVVFPCSGGSFLTFVFCIPQCC